MLLLFSGEFGNMITGGLSTHLAEHGIHTDITSPVIIQENIILSGHQRALQRKKNIEKRPF